MYTVPHSTLMEALEVVVPFRVWALPVGRQAAQLLGKIAHELKAPGYGVRTYLHSVGMWILEERQKSKDLNLCRVFVNSNAYQGRMFHQTLQRYLKYREALLKTFGVRRLHRSSERLTVVSALLGDACITKNEAAQILRGELKGEDEELVRIVKAIGHTSSNALKFSTLAFSRY